MFPKRWCLLHGLIFGMCEFLILTHWDVAWGCQPYTHAAFVLEGDVSVAGGNDTHQIWNQEVGSAFTMWALPFLTWYQSRSWVGVGWDVNQWRMAGKQICDGNSVVHPATSTGMWMSPPPTLGFMSIRGDLRDHESTASQALRVCLNEPLKRKMEFSIFTHYSGLGR